MNAYKIPMNTEASSYFTQSVNLDGTAFSLRFLWNARDGFFYMDVSTTEGERTGIRMVPGSPLLGKSPVTDKGDFYLLSEDSSAGDGPQSYDDFGAKWNLYWVPKE